MDFQLTASEQGLMGFGTPCNLNPVNKSINQSINQALGSTDDIVTDKEDHQCVVKIIPLKMKILLKGAQPSVADVTLKIGMSTRGQHSPLYLPYPMMQKDTSQRQKASTYETDKQVLHAWAVFENNRDGFMHERLGWSYVKSSFRTSLFSSRGSTLL